MIEVIKISELTKRYSLYRDNISRLKEALSIKGKKYSKDFYALNNINLTIHQGEIIGVLGKNGAGKSTLLKIITGIVTPTNGSVTTSGKISSLLELGAGFNPELTGMENIFLNGSIMGFSESEIRDKLQDILDFADIGDFVHQPVKMYSSGMFARLAFSVSINVEPDILIVDEALSVGDLKFQLKCIEKFNQFRERGKTIIFVSHDINAVKRFCTRCIWIDEGQIKLVGNTDYVTDRFSDFLKKTDKKVAKEQGTAEVAEIVSVERLEPATRNVRFGDSFKIMVSYDVKEGNVKKPVLGLAIYSIDGHYICGLNTLLDNIDIPWEQGLNTYCLTYHNTKLLGGEYYFEVALYESNASIPFHYKSLECPLFIESSYIGEGVFVHEHSWED